VAKRNVPAKSSSPNSKKYFMIADNWIYEDELLVAPAKGHVTNNKGNKLLRTCDARFDFFQMTPTHGETAFKSPTETGLPTLRVNQKKLN